MGGVEKREVEKGAGGEEISGGKGGGGGGAGGVLAAAAQGLDGPETTQACRGAVDVFVIIDI